MIIGICGGTGSGKTTVANRILESVSKDEVVFLQQDSYYRDGSRLSGARCVARVFRCAIRTTANGFVLCSSASHRSS